MSATAMATNPNLVSGSSPPLVDRTEYREALARRVAGAFAKLADHRDDIAALWKEFEKLTAAETIMGCRSKTEFCEKVLDRDIRTIQYLIHGRPSQAKSKPHEQSSRPIENHDADKEWDKAKAAGQVPEFVQKKAPEAYASIVFRCATKKDLDALAKATGQKLTVKTKYAWFPYRSHRRNKQ